MKNKIIFPALAAWVPVLLMLAGLLAAFNKEQANVQRFHHHREGDMPGVLDEFRILLGEETTSLTAPSNT